MVEDLGWRVSRTAWSGLCLELLLAGSEDDWGDEKVEVRDGMA